LIAIAEFFFIRIGDYTYKKGTTGILSSKEIKIELESEVLNQIEAEPMDIL